jgi:phosphomannomutase
MLIKSVSGIRGTIGGLPEKNLTPVDIVKYTAAFVYIIRKKLNKSRIKIVVGRDARISGQQVYYVVSGTLTAMGADVVNIGQATTPTVEIAVTEESADGGIIITASHNPKQWNALKLLNEKGEFLSANDGEILLNYAENEFSKIVFSDIDFIGKISEKNYLKKHVELIIKNKYVDIEAIKKANFKVVIDAVNSVGGTAIPYLLNELGVKHIVEINCEPTGEFAHNPEPLPENLIEISEFLKHGNFDVGFVVDPDVDRLAIVNENGSMFGEEYTLVAVADYVLSKTTGNTVSNLSSTRALSEITRKYKGNYYTSAVGEVNVVEQMKKVNAVIGGEGNGGVILPDIHYGRDSLIAVALFLSHLANSGKKCSELRADYPDYYISKNKIELQEDTNTDSILNNIKNDFKTDKTVEINTIDGIKLDFKEGWVHLRKSNTEPIIRIYAESKSEKEAEKLAQMIIKKIERHI